MCGRYWIGRSREMDSVIEEMNRSSLVDRWQKSGQVREAGEDQASGAIKTSGEVFPADIVPVIAPDRYGDRAVFPMKWGFSGKSLLINARSETASERPTFKEAWERHRCIVPASWYFEWEHFKGNGGRTRTGDKYMIRPDSSEMTWICGLYRIEGGLPVFVILTREPGEGIRFIHDRMPLILPERYIGDWIRPDSVPEELLSEAVTEMRFEKAE